MKKNKELSRNIENNSIIFYTLSNHYNFWISVFWLGWLTTAFFHSDLMNFFIGQLAFDVFFLLGIFQFIWDLKK